MSCQLSCLHEFLHLEQKPVKVQTLLFLFDYLDCENGRERILKCLRTGTELLERSTGPLVLKDEFSHLRWPRTYWGLQVVYLTAVFAILLVSILPSTSSNCWTHLCIFSSIIGLISSSSRCFMLLIFTVNSDLFIRLLLSLLLLLLIVVADEWVAKWRVDQF